MSTPAHFPATGSSSVYPSCLVVVSPHQPQLSPNHCLGHTGPVTPVPSSSWLVGASDGDLEL